VNAMTRWAVFGLLLCAAGGIGLRVVPTASNTQSEPSRLPTTLSDARPLGSADLQRLPPVNGEFAEALIPTHDGDQAVPRLHKVSHQTSAILTTIAAPAAPSAAPTNVQVQYQNDSQQTETKNLNSAPTVRIRKSLVEFLGDQAGLTTDETVVLFLDGRQVDTAPRANGKFHFSNINLQDGIHTIRFEARNAKNTPISASRSPEYKLGVRVGPVRVDNIDESALANDRGPYLLRVRFNTSELLETQQNSLSGKFSLKAIDSSGNLVAQDTPEQISNNGVTRDPGSDTVVLRLKDIQPGLYRLTITGGANGVQDEYGNLLDGNDPNKRENFIRDIVKPIGGVTPSVRPGITGSSGPYVPYTEFTKPRNVPDGFNPNDKVETRVVRLYYYRDAHRVAQIVNRKVQSYNRAGVDMQRQLADKARKEADDTTAARQHGEREAIIKAQKTREKERELQAAEQTLNETLRELTTARLQGATASASTDPQNVISQLQSVATSVATRVQNLRGQVEQLRDTEVEANERVQQLESQEKLAREDQFRREVAAAHADPDTYAPGVPTSDDPVEQVSVSVIGEGLIQLRGPLKGINQIRTTIDQIDAPAGQVRVSVHTIQINGEKADKMEVVAKQIQTYIDHARFLTMQSAEMLRRAVVQVASRKAEQARGLFPGDTQMDRDHRYLYSFFGKDFIDELEAMDSEFLRTGNKLLSLHSMDTTSLSSALNLMALAKNSTRQEIFNEFDMMLQSQLPQTEANYLAAGQSCPPKHFQWPCSKPKYCMLAQNAKFESLRGFFNTETGHDDTMTPLQREFIRLAQIFKSRLITEVEYKQRVMERAIIEERLGNRLQELQTQRQREQDAVEQLEQAQRSIYPVVEQVVTTFVETKAAMQAVIKKGQDDYSDFTKHSTAQDEDGNPVATIQFLSEDYASVLRDKEQQNRPWLLYDIVEFDNASVFYKIEPVPGQPGKLQITTKNIAAKDIAEYYRGRTDKTLNSPKEEEILHKIFLAGIAMERQRRNYLEAFRFQSSAQQQWQDAVELLTQLENDVNKYGSIEGSSVKSVKTTQAILYDDIRKLDKITRLFNELFREVNEAIAYFVSEADLLVAKLGSSHDYQAIYEQWVKLRNEVSIRLQDNLLETWKTRSGTLDDQFSNLVAQSVKVSFAETNALRKRRSLDHKKFLDMLIDDLEEKYIELLNGTRAHTANIDNYLKRLTTALDDDFNTQFYFPTFRYVRGMSTSWDVQFGQTETTSILANNREFAKVEPSATMEFDLPKRDILLSEAINGAKAMMDDVGALANDPSFLAMAKMKSGGSTASPGAGSTGGAGVMRSVLPGLSASTAEQVMSQNANGGNQFGANLENLIPDPAIYKFETGTGFEIRPVIQPDGQAVVFDFQYMYTTNIREPVRADEKHLGRVKRHFIDTDVQLSNFELREVSRYQVALKAARTSKGVPLFEDIPLVGVLFRPLPSAESSLQQNLIMAQATIFPTLFDLMGLRWAPVVADLDPLRLANADFIVRNRHRVLQNRVYDESSSYVDSFLRIPEAERRMDLYRTQETIRSLHPNGYEGPGMNLRDSQLQEGYQPERVHPQEQFAPAESREGAPFRPGRGYGVPQGTHIEQYPLENTRQGDPVPHPQIDPHTSSRRPPNELR
jgi:hypothetical protein